MHYSTLLVAGFAAMALAAPGLKPRAAVLGVKTYDELSISGGTAGTAEADATARFATLDLTNMAAVDKADLDFLADVNKIGNQAEVGAYNTALETATGDAKVAIQNGKIQNKVLKLMATVLKLQIQAAQGKNTTEKLAVETKKLNNNIATDKKNAGQPATKLTFDAVAGQGAARNATAGGAAKGGAAAGTGAGAGAGAGNGGGARGGPRNNGTANANPTKKPKASVTRKANGNASKTAPVNLAAKTCACN